MNIANTITPCVQAHISVTKTNTQGTRKKTKVRSVGGKLGKQCCLSIARQIHQGAVACSEDILGNSDGRKHQTAV